MNLAYYRKQFGITQQSLSQKLKVSRSIISMWEHGVCEPDIQSLKKLSEIFGISVDELLGNPPKNSSGVRIPVLGNVAAGIPIEAITDIEDFEEITPDLAATGEFVALRIHGQSMEPKISDGDVVIVRVQDTAETGDVAIVLVNGDDATCKKIKKTPEGVMLISLNPAYEPMFYSNKQIAELPVRIFGRVVELRAKF